MSSINQIRREKLVEFNNNCSSFRYIYSDETNFSVVKNKFMNDYSRNEQSTNNGIRDFCSFGRICFVRKIGNISFISVRRGQESIQLIFKKSTTTNIDLQKYLDLGDVIDFSGKLGYSSTGEISVFVDSFNIKNKCFEQPAEKWNGVTDKEVIYSQRHLDIISNVETAHVFIEKNKIINKLRNYFSYLLEVDTPILHTQASGATAKPFDTHHNFSNKDMHLRISPELYLKRLMVSNIHENGVFEIAKTFRNESCDSTHNAEFSLLEAYEYSKFSDTEGSFNYLIEKIKNIINIFFNKEFFIWSFKDNWEETCNSLPPGLGSKADYFSEVVEPYLLNKYKEDILMIIHHPIEDSPLAKPYDEYHAARCEVFINQMEIMNAYVEQNDVDFQRKAFEKQGFVDEDYLSALSIGLPNCIGIGIGIERIVMATLNLLSIKDVILFPH